jgi:hypothetical protein
MFFFQPPFRSNAAGVSRRGQSMPPTIYNGTMRIFAHIVNRFSKKILMRKGSKKAGFWQT